MVPFRSLRAVLVLAGLVFLAGPLHAQTPLGTYTDHTTTDTSVTVWADSSGLRLVWYQTDVLRVDLLPTRPTPADTSVVVARDPGPQPSFTVTETTGALTVSTAGLTARVQKDPVRLRIEAAGGGTLLEEPDAAGFVADGDARRAQFALPSDTRFYGTGERGLDINLRGERFRSYNEQHFGYGGVQSTMNINVPLLLTTDGYALLFDDPYPGTFDLGNQDPSTFQYEAEGGELSYFVLAGEDAPAQLERYTWLTGRPPIPPKWALGYIQSKFGYRDAQAARDVVDQLRSNDVPADGLILDLYWFRQMGDLAWDTGDFPNPQRMIADFEARGIKTFVITEPYLTNKSQWYSAHTDPGTPRAAQRNGSAWHTGWWSCGLGGGDGSNCQAVLTDFTHAPTRAWWVDRYQAILNDGVHGLWTDLGEPEAHPSDVQHVGGPADAVHNIYNLLWTRTAREAFVRERPNRRFVNLTRSGYAGIQRYGVLTWSADVSRSFSGLALQRPIMLNTTLSGLYYHSSDVGGFSGSTSPELYTRWMQMGAFTPILRPHGVDNEPTEPWRIGSPALSVSRRYVKLRYRLLPYLYTMAYRAYDTGMPIVRPLFFEDPDASRLAEEDAAYLFGDSFLVAPVVQQGKRTKDVPLPPGTWINYWTDEPVQGGQTVTVDAPLDRLPLFVRKGAVVPMRPEAPDYVGHSEADTLELAVYPSESGGQFTLYEDDGYTRAYEQGAFATTTFSQQTTRRDTGTTLGVTLGATQGTFEGRPDQRTYHVVAHRVFRAPDAVTLDGQTLAQRSSPAALRETAEGYAYDQAEGRLHVRTTTDVGTAREIEAQFENGLIPVELARFEAEATDAAVRLRWETASETDNARFQVQRRTVSSASVGPSGTASWSTIGEVAGGGTTSRARSYEFTDEDLPFAADSLAYRLRQEDTDGRVSVSAPVTVARSVRSVRLLPPAPNPARRRVTIRYATPTAQSATLSLYDVLGRRVKTLSLGEGSGRRQVQLDLSDVSSGVYFLRLRTDTAVKTQRMTVVN